MKTLKCVLVILSFTALMLISCSDEIQSPVAPVDQVVSLEKSNNVEFSFTSSPEPFSVNPADYLKIVGKTMHLKDYPVTDNVVATDNRMTGKMEHVLSLKVDINTGEGPCHGSFTLYSEAAEGGYWEGNYEGYRSKTENPFVFTLPLKMVAHGKGGTIDKMQTFMKVDLFIYTNEAYFPLPIFWTATGTGVIKEH